MNNKFSLAFYNLENFFDTKNDPNTFDDAFTPKGIMHWVAKRYFNKSKKIGFVISRLGLEETDISPAFIGLGEVENKRVLKDLIQSKYLKKLPYDFVHYDSEDRRGMDVALLYRKDMVQVLESNTYPVILYKNDGTAYKSRDILYVKARLDKQIFHLFINHWPSRREGDRESDNKRLKAAQYLRELINYISYEEDNAKIVVLGDFNTDPDDQNIESELVHPDLFNPAKRTFQKGNGSLRHQKVWHLFDQIMLSRNFISGQAGFAFSSFNIFKPDYLKVWHGKYKNIPFRTYKGTKYQNGYSDHFPVYCVLEK